MKTCGIRYADLSFLSWPIYHTHKHTTFTAKNKGQIQLYQNNPFIDKPGISPVFLCKFISFA